MPGEIKRWAAVGLPALLLAPTASYAEGPTIASATEGVVRACRIFVDKDKMDVRAFEKRLAEIDANFSEISHLRLYCEIYAKGREDADWMRANPGQPLPR